VEAEIKNPDLELATFPREFPAYPTTHILDDLRAVEYARLDRGEHVYFDYTCEGKHG
jgi:hypothetical protein